MIFPTDKGFIKIRRGVNICDITRDVMYPVIKEKPLKPIWAPTNCFLSGHVNKSDGTYLKSYCVDIYIWPFSRAKSRCLDQRMKLYELDSPEATSEILRISDARWTSVRWRNELHIAPDKNNRLQKLSNKEPDGPVS